MSASASAPMVTIPGWVVEELIQPPARANGQRAKAYWCGRWRAAAEQYPSAEEAIAGYRKLQRRAATALGPLRARATTLLRPAT